MNLDKKYISNLVVPDPTSVRALKGGVCRINKDTSCILIEVVTKVEFNSLYANLLVRLYNDGVLERLGINIDANVVNKVKFFLENRYAIMTDMEEYIKYRTWVNSVYLSELRKQTPLLFDVFYQYMNQYCNEIESLNKYTWLYTDTDMMYFAGRDVVIPDIGLPRMEDRVELLYIEGKKKYVEYNTSDYQAIGYGKHHQPIDIISIMKQKIRDCKLNSIGI